MIRYRLVLNAPSSKRESDRTVTVAIHTEHGDEAADMIWSGRDWAVDHAQRILERQRGLAGQMVGSRTTPRHLAAAMTSAEMKAFQPVLECGADLLSPPSRESLEEQTERIAAMAASLLLLHLPSIEGPSARAHNTAVDAVDLVAENWRSWRSSYPSPTVAIRAIGPAIVRQLPLFAKQLGLQAADSEVPISLPTARAEQLAASIDAVIQNNDQASAGELAVSLRDLLLPGGTLGA
jgi:hypothetical protein